MFSWFLEINLKYEDNLNSLKIDLAFDGVHVHGLFTCQTRKYLFAICLNNHAIALKKARK